MRAIMAVFAVKAYCQRQWPNDSLGMETHVIYSMPFDFTDSGSHKYIPSERLTKELGLTEGSGVYGYCKLSDGSYVLLTCSNGLAVWSGKDDEPAVFRPLPEPVHPNSTGKAS